MATSDGKKVLFIGLGEVGVPLYEVVRGVYPLTVAYDIKWEEVSLPENIDVLHICYPYSETFVKNTVDYAEKTKPLLLLIESTVLPGTTNIIAERLKGKRTHVAHSPIRARKADGYKWGLFTYTKFIGPTDRLASAMAEDYYQSLGFKTRVCKSALETEFAKLLNLSYYALMLGWWQEIRRISQRFGLKWEDITSFIHSTDVESGGKHRRPVYDGGFIGGHCVIPGAQLLYDVFPSEFIKAVVESNTKRKRGK